LQLAGQIHKLDELCIGKECPLYQLRYGKRNTNKEIEIIVCGEKRKLKNYTRLKAIRQKCLDCSAGDKVEIKNCICYEGNPEEVEPCPLWIYRMGKNPHRRGIGNKNTKPPLRSFKNSSLNDEMLEKYSTECSKTKEKFLVNMKTLTNINLVNKG